MLAGATVMDRDRVDCPSVAVSVAVWTKLISPVAVIVKVAELEPAAISTDAGTINCVGKVLDSVTTVSTVGAGARVTLQLEEEAALSEIVSHCNDRPADVFVDLRAMVSELDELPTVADTVTN